MMRAFDSTHRYVCRNYWGCWNGLLSVQPTSSIALMFMQKNTELFWFDSEAFDSALSVCWQPFNPAPQVQPFANQARVRQLHTGVSADETSMKLVEELFGKLLSPVQARQCPLTALCYMWVLPLPNTGRILKSWWMRNKIT